MKNVLVVDNNSIMLEFMSELLSNAGYTVQTAENGLASLKVLQTFIPDVIFIDLVMPRIDGRQLLRILKQHEKFRNIPTVVLSAIAAEEKHTGFPELADACIAKMPFRKMKDVVLEVLKDLETGKKGKYRGRTIGVDQLYKRDITEELLVTQHHNEMLIESLTDGFIELTPDRTIIFANPAALTILGVDERTLLGEDFSSLFPAENKIHIDKTIASLHKEPQELGEDRPIVLCGRRLLIRFIPVTYDVHRSVVVVIQDITERKKAEELTRESLEQKETLLKEIHHRVKNNLQIVASFLSLQSRLLNDEKIEQYFQESQNRIAAMALIHEQLYDAVDLSGIRLDSYLQDLIAQLVHTYGSQDRVVRTSVSAPDMPIPIERAVPLGLIVNELVTNSLVHGVSSLNKKEGEGRIELTITKKDDHHTLIVRDNGPGLPEDFDISASGSLGLSLVETLAQQLNGKLTFEDGEGAVAVVHFRIE